LFNKNSTIGSLSKKVPGAAHVSEINVATNTIKLTAKALGDVTNDTITFSSVSCNLGSQQNPFSEIFCVKLTAAEGTVYFQELILVPEKL